MGLFLRALKLIQPAHRLSAFDPLNQTSPQSGLMPRGSLTERSLASRYLAALLAPSLIAGVMQVTWPFFQSAPVAPYFVAVIFCAWYGGLGPGLLATTISFFLSDFLFIEPYFFFWPSKEFDLGRILLFAVVGPFISVMSELLHRERRRAGINLDSARLAEESLTFFRTLIDQSSDAIEVLDPTTLRFLDCNTTAHQWLGYTREEFLALTAFDIDPAIDQPSIAQVEKEIDKSSFMIFESVHRRKDGSIFPVEINVKNIRLEREYRLAVIRDITDRKRAEAALRESEERFRQIAENLQDVLWMVDSNVERLLYVNPAYEKIWGASSASLYQDLRAFMEPVHPEDREVVVRMLEEQKGSNLVSAEYRIIRSDGSVRWIRDRSFPVRNAEGEVYRIAGVAEDVTASKQAEQALKATSEQLRALSARLQSAREEEGRRIARELHDELGSALTSLRWGLDEIDSLLSTAIPKDIDPLREKLATATTLVEGTLETVRRISSELRPGILDDMGLIVAIEWEAQQFQARTGIVCHFDSSVDRVQLTRAQSTAIFRIFQEALTNVLRHAKATGVDVTIKEEEDQFVLKIRDNGRGITGEENSGAKSLGLLGMRERAYLIGGEVNIRAQSQGTVVSVRVRISGAQPLGE